MNPKDQRFEMTRGETRQWTLDVTKSCQAQSLAGIRSLTAAGRAQCSNGGYVTLSFDTLSGRVTIPDAARGSVLLSLGTADTVDLPNEQLSFDMSWTLVDGAGNENVLLRFALVVLPTTVP